jgi:hypothetical protein
LGLLEFILRSSEVIRVHQSSSEFIRVHQRSSEVIRGHQRSSDVLLGLLEVACVFAVVGEEEEGLLRVVISGHQRSSEVIRGHQWSSVPVCRGPRAP